MANSRERRLHYRAGIKWPVSIKTKEGVVDGKTKNIGIDGALVYYDQPFSYDQPLRENERFAITIRALNHWPLEIDAEVIWYDIFSTDERNVIYGMGLRFSEISDDDREIIAQAISYHLNAKKAPQ
jgi:hypothetical protein